MRFSGIGRKMGSPSTSLEKVLSNPDLVAIILKEGYLGEGHTNALSESEKKELNEFRSVSQAFKRAIDVVFAESIDAPGAMRFSGSALQFGRGRSGV